MNVHFGSRQIILQSKAYGPVREREAAVEAIRKRIRGDIEVLGYDREVDEAIRTELGKPQYDRDSMEKEVEGKFDTFLKGLLEKQGSNPHYQGILFFLGNRPNPLNPAERVPQKLLIDGEDVQAFQQAVFNRAFFRRADTIPQGGFQGFQQVHTPIHNSTEYYVGKGMENHFSSVINAAVREIEEQAKQGDTSNIIDLDA